MDVTGLTSGSDQRPDDARGRARAAGQHPGRGRRGRASPTRPCPGSSTATRACSGSTRAARPGDHRRARVPPEPGRPRAAGRPRAVGHGADAEHHPVRATRRPCRASRRRRAPRASPSASAWSSRPRRRRWPTRWPGRSSRAARSSSSPTTRRAPWRWTPSRRTCPMVAMVETPAGDQGQRRPWVWLDDRKAAAQATRYLLSLGHRTVHYLAIPSSTAHQPAAGGLARGPGGGRGAGTGPAAVRLDSPVRLPGRAGTGLRSGGNRRALRQRRPRARRHAGHARGGARRSRRTSASSDSTTRRWPSSLRRRSPRCAWTSPNSAGPASPCSWHSWSARRPCPAHDGPSLN